MWIGDVGQNAWEEVNFRAAGSLLGLNYRWPCMEANHELKADCGYQGIGTNVNPIFEYNRDLATGGRSITGGFVYRGTEFPSLQGYYIASDFVTDHGWLIKPDGSGGWNTTFQSNWAADITSYGEAENGEIYATSLGAGTAGTGILYKVIVSSALPVHLVSFDGRLNGTQHELNWHVQNEEKGDVYIIEKKGNPAEPFNPLNTTTSTANRTSNRYSLKVAATGERTFYRLRIKGVDGREHFSSVVSLQSPTKQIIKATVSGSLLQLHLPPGATACTIMDAAGKVVLQKKLSGRQQEQLSLHNVSKGILTIKVQLLASVETARVVY
jgi:hypothetical protein